MTRLEPTWQAWSDEALALMDRRNDGWQNGYDLHAAPYQWRLQPPELVYQREADVVVAALCLVGTCAAATGDFLWAWGDPTVDRDVYEGLDVVRRFGAARGWSLLTEPRVKDGEQVAERLAAVAGRIQDAAGTFVDGSGELTLVFTIRAFRLQSSAG